MRTGVILMVIPFSLSKSIAFKYWGLILSIGIVFVISKNLSAKVDLPWFT